MSGQVAVLSRVMADARQIGVVAKMKRFPHRPGHAVFHALPPRILHAVVQHSRARCFFMRMSNLSRVPTLRLDSCRPGVPRVAQLLECLPPVCAAWYSIV